MTTATALRALPDPATQSEFYRDVPAKRLLAFIIDCVAILLLTAIVVVLTAFTALFVLGGLLALVGFLYRWLSIAAASATPGMRILAIEFRNHRGERFGPVEAAVHTFGFTLSMSMVLPQIVSVALMLLTPRRQGLTDMLLGTVAVNRRARA